MENFDGTQRKIKEKSVYLLHLDVPRMVLIGSVVVGVIIASFLFGMNFVKNEHGKNLPLAGGDLLMDNQNIPGLSGGSIPPPPDSDPFSQPDNDRMRIAVNSTVKPGTPAVDNSFQGGSVDVLTNENINEVIPPSSTVKKVTSEKEIKTARPVNTAKSTKKAAKKKVKKAPARKKGRVVEVSDSGRKKELAASGPSFAIQVASYDKKSKARAEVQTLKDRKYDAFIDRTRVKGKQYYRVRIGPIASKGKAIRLLNSIQEESRYENSYMVRE